MIFSAGIAERIVGITPELGSTTRHYRYNEVLLFFKRHRIVRPSWVAIKDDDEH